MLLLVVERVAACRRRCGDCVSSNPSGDLVGRIALTGRTSRERCGPGVYEDDVFSRDASPVALLFAQALARWSAQCLGRAPHPIRLSLGESSCG